MDISSRYTAVFQQEMSVLSLESVLCSNAVRLSLTKRFYCTNYHTFNTYQKWNSRKSIKQESKVLIDFGAKNMVNE